MERPPRRRRSVGAGWSRPELKTLAELVAFPSVSSRPMRDLAAYVAERCEDLGFGVEYFEDPADPTRTNVVCTAGPAPEAGGEGLILSGHLDVVPVDGQPWASDPFVLTERGGRLYARGSSDMKGFVAASLEALGQLQLPRLRAPLVLIWTYDEEIGCAGSQHLVRQLAQQRRALPTEALIGEPTDLRVLRMHPGHVTLRLRAQGVSAHSSKPDLGASAITAMGRVLGMLERLAVELQGERRFEDLLERPWVTMNPGILRGGAAVNMVADHCELWLGYRPLPGDDPLAVARRVEARLQELPLPAGTAVSLEVVRETPAMLTPEGIPLQGLLCAHASHPALGAAAFATDGGNLAALGIRSLIFGPGSIDVAHKPDEYIEAAALTRGVEVVEAVVRARCGG